MRRSILIVGLLGIILGLLSCGSSAGSPGEKSAAQILGNPEYQAICYGGFRENTRQVVPSVEEIKEDLKILHAMGIRVLRTYNTQQFAHAANLLEAIRQMKSEDPSFEMYVMLGAWIDCLGAWTDVRDHTMEDEVNNKAEVGAAVEMVNKYPDIVKIIAVGNEAMVHWAESYFVGPEIILKWVNHLQTLKKEGKIPADTWITSSDNFASWGGGDASYHKEALTELFKAVDYVSIHTYPFHDTHYNSDFWLVPGDESGLDERARADAAMLRARDYAIRQYRSVESYMNSLGVDKPIHIGETGWASVCGFFYGPEGSRAADEYKQARYHSLIRDWTDQQGISCFYFEAFDESWKDSANVQGSENHFGLLTIRGEAKYALWPLVDAGVFDGLGRNGTPVTKSYGGDENLLMQEVLAPPPVPAPATEDLHSNN